MKGKFGEINVWKLILIWKGQCVFFHSTFQFRFVSLVKCFFSQNTKHSKLTFARKSQFRETQNFAKQGADFREIRNSFRMKFSRFLYERNSSVNPRFNTLPKTIIKVVAKNCRKLLAEINIFITTRKYRWRRNWIFSPVVFRSKGQKFILGVPGMFKSGNADNLF